MQRPDARYWSPFWQHPTLTSFGELFPRNYDGVMLEFWRRQLAGDVREVLDLACGNGALAWIANDFFESAGTGARITGVDFAAIEPFAVLGRRPEDFPRVRFLAGTPLETLPLPDASADLAISQYGLEYADIGASIAEVGRVLGPRGRIALILHDRDSVIVRGATEHLDDLRRVRDELRPAALCIELDQLLRTDGNVARLTATPAFRALDARLAEALYRTRALARYHPPWSPLFRHLELLERASALRLRRYADERRALAVRASATLAAHIERIEDLWRAALTPDARAHLRQLVMDQGFTVTECEVLRYRDGDNFGTTFAARRG